MILENVNNYVGELVDSENDNEKVNVQPTVSCIDDLDFFKDFENEFPAIVYNDALTSKSGFSTKPILCPQHIDKFNLKDETSLFEYDEVEQYILNFNDLFPFNIIYPDDQKSDKGNDDNEIDMIQSLRGNENTQGSNKLLEGSHDKISKVFIMRSVVMELNVKIVAWNHLVNGMLFNLINYLYVPFGISFNPKWYYKDGDCARMLRRPRTEGLKFYERFANLVDFIDMEPLPPRDQRHLWLRYQVVGYTEEIVHDFGQRLETIFGRQVNRVHILDFEGLTPDMRQDLAERMRMVYTEDDKQEEMAEDGFGAYWLGSERLIPDKGDLSDYWVEISSGRDFLRGAPSYTYIRDPVQRHAKGRKSGSRLSGGHFIGRLTHHFGLPIAAAGAPEAAEDAPRVNEGVQADLAPIQAPQPPTPPPATGRTMP
ncbi:hypothetical protein Tco_1493222 [Tanacetum coccineum]